MLWVRRGSLLERGERAVQGYRWFRGRSEPDWLLAVRGSATERADLTFV
jgi:hypothetical protein